MFHEPACLGIITSTESGELAESGKIVGKAVGCVWIIQSFSPSTLPDQKAA
jgi:hypothetical protein